MANVNPDLFYQQGREDLLLYEDSRLNSLLNATANFYLTKNDQSLWGVFLRALAQELARLEYDYAYDLVAKDPQYLTPSDIRRRWADPLFVNRQYPSSGQTDLDYRTMLVELLTAYKQGATPKAIQDVILAYTGIQVVVQELYKQIGDGIFDISDTNAIRVSVNVGGNDPLKDIQTLSQLQLIVSALYGAIDLTKPAHVGLEFTTVFGTDEDIDAYVSYTDHWQEDVPGINDDLTITIRLVESEPYDPMLYQAPILDPTNPTTTLAAYGRQFAGSYAQLNPTDWSNLTKISSTIASTIADGTNATYQLSGLPMNGAVVAVNNMVTVDVVNSFSAGEKVRFAGFTQATWLNGQSFYITQASGTQITGYFANKTDYGITNITSTEVTSNVVTVKGTTFLPAVGQHVKLTGLTTSTFLNNQALTVASVLSDGFTAAFTHANYAATADTGIATLQESAGGSVYTFLQDDMEVMITGCSRSVFNISGKIFNTTDLTFQLPLAQTLGYVAESSAELLVTPTLQSAYFNKSGTYVLGLTSWSSGLVVFQGQMIMDLNGHLQMATNTGTTDTLVPGSVGSITSVAAASGGQTTYTGTFNPVFLTGYPVAISKCSLSENNGTFNIISCTGTTLVVDNAAGRAETLSTAARATFNPWGTAVNSQITDGTVVWRSLGTQTLTPSYKWLMLLPPPIPGADPNVPLLPTGEVANLDATHPMGLVAPRLNQAWEVSGGDTFASFEIP